MARQTRFGVVNETALSGRAWVDHVRRVEDGGIDVLLVRDHLSAEALGPQWAPFSALATRPPRPIDCASARWCWRTTSAIPRSSPTKRRPWRTYRAVVSNSAWIEGLSLELLPAPGPPLLIGGGGPKMLAFAASVADIVGVLPAPIRSPTDDESAADRLPEAFDRKLDIVRREAGPDRFAALDVCAFVTIVVTDHKRDATERLIAERGWTGVTPEEVWTIPTIFIGSLNEIRDLLHERRERFALSYLVASDRDLETVSHVATKL